MTKGRRCSEVGVLTSIHIHSYTGSASLRYANALAELRIDVFREWPYLYEGSLDYEKNYLAHYAKCPEAVLVLARQGSTIVGASTGLPLRAADEAFRLAFGDSAFSVEDIFYFGESVLLPEFRGQGIGRQFFKHREAHARSVGAKMAAFCAVARASDDPRRPTNCRELQPFWNALGYTKQPEIEARLNWKEIGQSAQTEHALGFWLKIL